MGHMPADDASGTLQCLSLVEWLNGIVTILVRLWPVYIELLWQRLSFLGVIGFVVNNLWMIQDNLVFTCWAPLEQRYISTLREQYQPYRMANITLIGYSI